MCFILWYVHFLVAGEVGDYYSTLHGSQQNGTNLSQASETSNGYHRLSRIPSEVSTAVGVGEYVEPDYPQGSKVAQAPPSQPAVYYESDIYVSKFGLSVKVFTASVTSSYICFSHSYSASSHLNWAFCFPCLLLITSVFRKLCSWQRVTSDSD